MTEDGLVYITSGQEGQAGEISGEMGGFTASFSPCPSCGRTPQHANALLREALPSRLRNLRFWEANRSP